MPFIIFLAGPTSTFTRNVFRARWLARPRLPVHYNGPATGTSKADNRAGG